MKKYQSFYLIFFFFFFFLVFGGEIFYIRIGVFRNVNDSAHFAHIQRHCFARFGPLNSVRILGQHPYCLFFPLTCVCLFASVNTRWSLSKTTL